MLTLYYLPGACSLAPHILLEWVGAEYQAVRVKRGDPDYLKINPAGAVPTLDVGEGWTLTQAGAILSYIAHRFPNFRFAGGDSLREQAEVERWSHFLTGDLHPAFFPYFFPGRYTTATTEEALKAARDASLKLVRGKYDLLEARLEGRTFIAGDRLTYIDAYAFPMIRWGAKALDDGLAAYPNIKAHHDRIAADEAVQRVLAKEAA